MDGFEDFEPIFNIPKIEWEKNSNLGLEPSSGQFLMHVFAPDFNHLKLQATDYHSDTFEAVKSVMQLDDLRDNVGIGGSWADFVDYFVASFKAEDVKLVLEKHSDGPACAKLVAQKSKGMPLISISLTKLVDYAASDAMANTSFGLFKAFKCMQNMVVKDASLIVLAEPDHSLQLTKVMLAEKESSESIQGGQLEKRQKLEKKNLSDKADSSALLATNGCKTSPDKPAARDPASVKVANRVVPAFRRAKVRGALLQDAEDEKEN